MRFRFDGGTVLLEGDGADDAARTFPGLRWDARVGAFRAPACAWPRIRQGLDPSSPPEGMRTTVPVLDGWRAVDAPVSMSITWSAPANRNATIAIATTNPAPIAKAMRRVRRSMTGNLVGHRCGVTQ